MSVLNRAARRVYPWRIAAVAIAALAMALVQSNEVRAINVMAVALDDFSAGAQTSGTITFQLDAPMNEDDELVLTFDADWVVANGALTVGNWTGLDNVPKSVTGDSGAGTVTIVIGAGGQGDFAAIPLAIAASAELVNPATPGNYDISISGDGQALGTTFPPVGITGPSVTGGNVVLTSFVAGAQTAGTIQFTLGAAMTAGQSIVLTFGGGWTVQNGAMTAANWQGLDGAVPTSVTGNAGSRTVTIVLSANQNTLIETLTIVASAELVNPNLAATNFTVGVAATGQTAGVSNAFNIVAGTPTAAQSSVAAAPASVAADGATTSTITVTMRDQFSNPVSGRTVTLAADAGSSIISAASGLSNAAGVVTFTVTNTVAEVVTYTATDTGAAVDVTQTAAVTFTAAGATSVTGVTISASPLTAGAGSTLTVTFTPSATGALAAGDTITVVVTGYTFAAAPIAITPTAGFAGTLTGAGNGASTVTVTLDGGASLAALTGGTFTFPATNPGAQTIAAGSLTVATSEDTAAVASGAGITITAPPPLVVPTPIVAPTLTALALVPQQSGFSRIDVPVVAGQLVYEVEVPAYDAATGTPMYKLAATMSDQGASIRVVANGIIESPPEGSAFKGGETFTFTATNGAGASPTYTVRLRAAVAPLTNAAVTLSNATAGATKVTATVTFTTPAAIPAGGSIVVGLAGFSWPASPVASFMAPAGTAAPASAAFANNLLTVTNSATAIAAGTVTLRITGATNPAAAQAARTDVQIYTTTREGVKVAETATGTLVAVRQDLSVVIQGPETAVARPAGGRWS